jgi:hypothetical protein
MDVILILKYLLFKPEKMPDFSNLYKRWHHLFSPYFLKPSVMPNQGNKSKGQSGIVQKKKSTTMPGTQKQGTASATKHSRGDNGQTAAGSDSKGGSKTIPDGSAND